MEDVVGKEFKIGRDICRLCLAIDIRMVVLTNTDLQGVYERIADVKLNSIPEPQCVCYICHAKLKQCDNLIQQAVLTEKVLKDALVHGIELNTLTKSQLWNLTTSSLLTITLDPNEKSIFDIKHEEQDDTSLFDLKEEDIKIEFNDPNHDLEQDTNEVFDEELIKSDIESDNNNLLSDSEDDVPLQSLSFKENTEIKIEKRKNKRTKQSKSDKLKAKVLLLDEDQQMAELLERAKSLNYLNSPYKCDLCYKGFLNPTAFSKHKDKHKSDGKMRKPKLSVEERKERKRLAQQKRRQKLRSDPVLREEYLRKERERYVKKKAAGVVVPRSAMTLQKLLGLRKKNLMSGRLECKICRLRYHTKQTLNSHSMSAHARRFVCTSCSHVSHTKHQAEVHQRWHSGYQYPCKLCDKQFSKPTTYLSHMRLIHAKFSEHVCRRCGESFAARHGLLMHLGKSHRHDEEESEVVADPASESYCRECSIQFLTLDAYNLHLVSSQKHKKSLWKENESKCIICNVLVSVSGRVKHERMHQKQLRPTVTEVPDTTPPTVPISCDHCKKSFPSRGRLLTHVAKMHLGRRYDKDIVCEVCGKHCTSNAALRYHQRAHTGERPFPCDKCPGRFASREHWRIHQRVHSGERPYSCALCSRSFSQKPALNRHYRVHTGAKPYECHLCNKAFTQSASLKKHVDKVHLRQPQNNKKKNGDDDAQKLNNFALNNE